MHEPDHKVSAMRKALQKRNPFYSGMCTIPDDQRHLFYTHDGLHHCVNFSNPGSDDLDALYRACNSTGENASRRNHGMKSGSFATSFDPHSLGIHEEVSRALLTHGYDATMHMELCRLSVHGKGDSSETYVDRVQQGQNTFGSLVVVFSTALEGGQFVLHKANLAWTIDFASNFVASTEPSVCFVAFYGHLEHTFLPVTSGYRVMLTYNLFHKPIHPGSSSLQTPFHIELKEALVALVNDPSTLPNGGYLGFGLVHEYTQTRKDLLGVVTRQLKGLDRALMDACNALGLRCSVRLLYRKLPICTDGIEINLLTSEALNVEDTLSSWANEVEYLSRAVTGLTMDQVEGVVFGQQVSMEDIAENIQYRLQGSTQTTDWNFLEPFYKDPITEVMEITQMTMSFVDVRSPLFYEDEAECLLTYFYGAACMVVAVEPAASRRAL